MPCVRSVDEYDKRNLAALELLPRFDETKLAIVKIHQVKFMTVA